jgi:hypothetical protein
MPFGRFPISAFVVAFRRGGWPGGGPPTSPAIGDPGRILEPVTGGMDPMLGKFELAAGDRGMGGFRHGVSPAYVPYVCRMYCTVPPATVNCGMRLADWQGGRPVPEPRIPVPAVPQSPSPPVAQLPSHLTLASGSRTPIPDSRRSPFGRSPFPPSAETDVSPFSEMRLTSIGTCPKPSNSMQERSKTSAVQSKKVKNGPSFVLPILTSRGSNALGASARADLTPQNWLFGGSKHVSHRRPARLTSKWPTAGTGNGEPGNGQTAKRPTAGIGNLEWGTGERRGGCLVSRRPWPPCRTTTRGPEVP